MGSEMCIRDRWATTKQACRDELVVYLCFFLLYIYFALLPCIEHCFTNIKFLHFTYVYGFLPPLARKISPEKISFFQEQGSQGIVEKYARVAETSLGVEETLEGVWERILKWKGNSCN